MAYGTVAQGWIYYSARQRNRIVFIKLITSALVSREGVLWLWVDCRCISWPRLAREGVLVPYNRPDGLEMAFSTIRCGDGLTRSGPNPVVGFYEGAV
jgi:hypothetical protein